MEDNNAASVLHFIKTGFRIPGTRLLFDLRRHGPGEQRHAHHSLMGRIC